MKPTYSIDHGPDGAIRRITINAGPTRVSIDTSNGRDVLIDAITSDRYRLTIIPQSQTAAHMIVTPPADTVTPPKVGE